jgi:3-dehydroquinate synthase
VSEPILIRSSVHDYRVRFVDDFAPALGAVLREGDVLVVDRKVHGLYEESIRGLAGPRPRVLLDATERQKSYLELAPVIETLIRNNFRKNNRLIAVGGGIIQDVVAFLAQNLYRGVDWLFLPTTLLAQADSCIGGKSSINFGEYKNQLGNFYPPNEILIDTAFLKTLDRREIRSGLGEMMHFFVLSSEADFERIRKGYRPSLTDLSVLRELIGRSLEIKRRTVEIDEFDRGERQIFNYGHSFGHAIESVTGYRVPHGIAVCHGMDIANYLSVKMGLVDTAFRDRVRGLLSMNWEAGELGSVPFEKFIGSLRKDKKNVGNEVRVILTRGFGKMFKTGIDVDGEAGALLKRYFEEELS